MNTENTQKLEKRSALDPASAGMLAAKHDAVIDAAEKAAGFKIGDAVEVAAVGIPARVVGLSPDGQTLEVVYDDMVEVFKVPARHATRQSDTPAAMAERIQKMETEMEDMRRQIADLIQERTTLRYAMRQIVDYTGSRYTDDAAVMQEIAEAALDGENITPRR